MLKTIGSFAVLAVLTVGLCFTAAKVLEPGTAHAQVALGRLTSNDAGATNTLTIPQLNNIEVQCVEPACLKLSLDGGIPACATDYFVPGRTANGSVGDNIGRSSRNGVINTGGFSRLKAMALDAGNPDCTVFQSIKNP